MSPVSKRRLLSVGDKILNGRYEVLKIIHTAGMANVYLVEDSNLNKQWCLKEIIKSEAGKNMVEYHSILREANIMKSLNHSSIPRIVTIEEEDDSLFIVMDFVDGLSVKKWLDKKGRVDQNIAVSWMKQVCGVMIYLHNRKNPIIYRDMKPDNIMIQSDGNIKVLDFGISEIITEDNKVIKEALGTKGFAAPEQRKRGMTYDLRSDIFAMGRTMYYMLTGLNPSAFKDDLLPLREVNSGISVGLEKIVYKCMMENPKDRYQNVEELLYDLQNYDKMDDAYTKGLRKKVDVVVWLFCVSVFILAMSAVPFLMNRGQINSEYTTLVNIAYQSGRQEDYIEAISKNPKELSPYLGYIESIKQDGDFTKEEESDLLNLINPVLGDIKSGREYGNVAYEIGKLYWFYYDDSLENCMVYSSKWFGDAKDKGYNTEESTIFYNLGQFKKNISMSIAESDDSGKYKEYWSELMKAKEYNTGEIVEIQVNIAIVDAVNSYSYRLEKDGISKDEMIDEVSRIGKYIKTVNPSEGKSTELFDILVSSYNTIDASFTVESSGGED